MILQLVSVELDERESPEGLLFAKSSRSERKVEGITSYLICSDLLTVSTWPFLDSIFIFSPYLYESYYNLLVLLPLQ